MWHATSTHVAGGRESKNLTNLHSPPRWILIFQCPIHKFSKPKGIPFHTKQMPSFRMSSLLRLNRKSFPFQIPLQSWIIYRKGNHSFSFIFPESQCKRLSRFKPVFLQISQIKSVPNKRKSSEITGNRRQIINLICPDLPPPGSSQTPDHLKFSTRFP